MGGLRHAFRLARGALVAARGGARATCAWSVPALEPRVAVVPLHPHLAFARAFRVNPSDKDRWEAFILGLPATLKRDIAYRKKLFYEVDKDHDGKVSMEELQTFLEGVNLDASTVRTLMSVADCSHDGKLCLEEFSDMIHAYLDNPRFEVD